MASVIVWHIGTYSHPTRFGMPRERDDELAPARYVRLGLWNIRRRANLTRVSTRSIKRDVWAPLPCPPFWLIDVRIIRASRRAQSLPPTSWLVLGTAHTSSSLAEVCNASAHPDREGELHININIGVRECVLVPFGALLVAHLACE